MKSQVVVALLGKLRAKMCPSCHRKPSEWLITIQGIQQSILFGFCYFSQINFELTVQWFYILLDPLSHRFRGTLAQLFVLHYDSIFNFSDTRKNLKDSYIFPEKTRAPWALFTSPEGLSPLSHTPTPTMIQIQSLRTAWPFHIPQCLHRHTSRSLPRMPSPSFSGSRIPIHLAKHTSNETS